MRRAFHAILRSALVAGATTGGSPCGDPCSQAPESRTLAPLFARDAGLRDAASDADAANEDASTTADAGIDDASVADATIDDASVADATIDDASAANDAYAPFLLPDGGLDCSQLCHVYSGAKLTCAPARFPDAAPAVECLEGPHTVCSGSGRGHAAVVPATFSKTADDVGRWLAAAAAGEAASVLAFRRLHAEYKHVGAPRKLLRQLSRAARDESRHARAVGALARAAGVRSASPPHLRQLPRDLEALALENAVEGCVNETYGAVLVAWQATHASDLHLRAVFGRIAPDEARHAELAWSLARYAERRLSPIARRRVHVARRLAFARLRREVALPPPALVARGLAPTAAVAEAMVAALEAALV